MISSPIQSAGLALAALLLLPVPAAAEGRPDPWFGEALYFAYGCGLNPAGSIAVLSGVPNVGSTMVFGIDNPAGTQAIGSVPILAVSVGTWPSFPCGITVPTLGMDGPGELLILVGPSLLKPLVIGGTLWAVSRHAVGPGVRGEPRQQRAPCAIG